jgi:hypothetical protein
MPRGHLRLSREYAFAGNPFWKQPREFSKWEAFVDLLQRAAFVEHDHYANGHLVRLQRGQLILASRFGAQQWGWSRGKVTRFLHDLIRSGYVTAVEHPTGQVGMLVTWLCFDTLQDTAGEDEPVIWPPIAPEEDPRISHPRAASAPPAVQIEEEEEGERLRQIRITDAKKEKLASALLKASLGKPWVGELHALWRIQSDYSLAEFDTQYLARKLRPWSKVLDAETVIRSANDYMERAAGTGTMEGLLAELRIKNPV